MAEKTEAPTPRRLAEARQHGQVAKSTELTSALVLLAAVWLLSGQGAQMSAALTALIPGCRKPARPWAARNGRWGQWERLRGGCYGS